MSSVAKALTFAKNQIEKTQNAFFRKSFEFEMDGVTVVMNGKYKLLSLSGSDGNQTMSFYKELYDGVYSIVKHAEMKGYVQDRNLVNMKFKVDIAKMLPEVAEAVAYMERKKTAAES